MNSTIQAMRARARARAQEAPEKSPSSRALDRVFRTKSEDDQFSDFVRNTPELERIQSLPTLRWQDREDLGQLQELLGAVWATGTMKLRPVQAVLLETLHDFGGVLGAVGVGEGKTLPTLLAPEVMGAQRALLIVPAKLKEKTRREFEELRKDWTTSREIKIVSYEWLGRVGAEGFLEDYDPDLIMADEVHLLKNPRAAVTRRVVRFLREKITAGARVPFMALSGTITSRSLMDFHHLLALTLGPQRMPLPSSGAEAKTWADAVDEKVQGRARPGALCVFTGTENPKLAEVREAVGKRIHETPGVVATDRKSVDASIQIHLRTMRPHPRIQSLLDQLIHDHRDPLGNECQPSDIYRHSRTLASGFFYRWDPPAPRDWAIARSQWARFVSDILDRELPGLDSELQVANQVDQGRLQDAGVLDRWRTIRKTFTPNSVPEWITTDPLREALKLDTGRTIFWVEAQAVGFKLRELSGLPFFHRLGVDEKGSPIEVCRSSCIASVGSNAEGRNLQHFSHNVVITPPASGRIWEQLLGRTHRQGQTADEVVADVILGASSIRGHFDQAIKDARFIQATTGQNQKLLLADVLED